MEASRKPDSTPSDRLIAGEEAHEAYLRATELEREHDASELEAHQQNHARVVVLMGQLRWAIERLGNTQARHDLLALHEQFASALDTFHRYAVDWKYRLAPRVRPDVDAERERRKLYGTTAQWFEDERDARMLEGEVGSDGLFDFERR